MLRKCSTLSSSRKTIMLPVSFHVAASSVLNAVLHHSLNRTLGTEIKYGRTTISVIQLLLYIVVSATISHSRLA